MPRVNGGYLSRYTQSDAISTGFSDSVNLGEIGRIQQSSEIVAHIRINGDTTGERQLRLRGAVLTNFDGHAGQILIGFRHSRAGLWPRLSSLLGHRQQ